MTEGEMFALLKSCVIDPDVGHWRSSRRIIVLPDASLLLQS